jgi:phospholipid-binding lipoprotein MlaA
MGLVAGVLGGCAEKPPADDPEAVAEFERANDPIEPFNRQVYAFNDTVDTYVLVPAAQRYRDYVPEFVRMRIRDFLNNLKSPVIFTNDVLQADPDKAGMTLFRFLLNTVGGVGGLFDVTPDTAVRHDNDLGQTLGVWGVGEGPYLVLPIFGPSNPRDAFGMGVEAYLDPVDRYATNMGYDWATYVRAVMSGIDRREGALDEVAEIKRTSVDPYSTIRSLYRQYREAQISGTGGKLPKPPGCSQAFPEMAPELSMQSQ